MAGVLVQGRVLRNTEERSGDLTASTYSLSSFFESVGDFFSKFMGTPSSSMRRSMTSQAYLEINTNLLTSERYKSAWDLQEEVLTSRLRSNIDNGFFQEVMQHPDDYLTHTHDGRVANA